MIDLKSRWLIVIPFLILTCYMSLIFSIGMPYRDDYARLIEGYFWWDHDGRPLANLFIYILNGGGVLTDVAPLSQALSIFISLFVCYTISEKVIGSRTVYALMSPTFLFLSPFYLQNLVYRFDIFSMSLSLAILCIPFYFLNARRLVVFIVSLFCVVSSLSTYQASLPLFFGIILLIHIHNNCSAEKIILMCISGALALILYKLAIAPIYLKGFYSTSHSTPINFMSSGGLSQFLLNLKYLSWRLHDLISLKWILVFSLPVIAGLCMVAVCVSRSFIRIKDATALAFSFFGFAFSVLIFFATTSPMYSARSFIGLSCVIFVVICSFKPSEGSNYYWCLLLLPGLFYYTSIALAYRSSAISQNNADKSVLQSIHDDLKGKGYNDIYIDGTNQKTDLYKRSVDKYPTLKEVLSNDIGGWHTKYFYKYEFPSYRENLVVVSASKKECDRVIKPFNGNYTIVEVRGNPLVYFYSVKC